MKNAGVPFTPLRTPPMKSLRTLFLYWPVSRAFRMAVSGSPSSAPIRKIVVMLSLLWFSNSIVPTPEQSRRAGELRAFGRDLGVRVYFGQREMPVNELHASAK